MRHSFPRANLTCLAAICGLTLFASPASALQIFVDQNSTWRYINATAGTTQAVPADWFTYGFNDSGWFTGNAPFTSSPTNPASTFGSDLPNAGTPYGGSAPPIPSSGTLWSVQADPYLRISFNLPTQQPITIWVGVDNGINSMYLNGVQATNGVNAEGQAFRWENVFDVASQYTYAGTNVLALQLEDHGGATAFALVVSSDDAAQNPVLTVNPPPPPLQQGVTVPEPGTLLILGLGLLGAGATRLRKNKREA